MDSRLTSARAVLDRIAAGDAHRIAEMFDAAIGDYEAAVRDEHFLTDEERAALRLHLADCLHAKNAFERSKEVLSPLLEPSRDDLTRARAMARVGWADYFLGDIPSCERLCGESVALLGPTSYHSDLARSQRWLGYALRWLGRLEESLDHYRDALAAARRGDDRSQIEACLRALGDLARLQGRYREAMRYHRECLERCRDRGSAKGVAYEHFHLALALFYMGEWAASAAELVHARQLFRQTGLTREDAQASLLSARQHRRRGDLASAEAAARSVLSEAEATGFARARVLALEELADCAAESGRFDQARDLLGQALDGARAIGPGGDLVYELLWRLARIRIGESRFGEAAELADKSVALAERSHDLRELGNALATLAVARAALGAENDALELVERAIDSLRSIGTPFEVASAHEDAAAVLTHAGHDAGSAPVLGHLLAAARIYSHLGATRAAERVREEIRAAEDESTHVATGPRAVDPTPIAETAEMQRLVSLVRDLAPYDTTVLLEGETGSGKEVLARLLHDAGPRHGRPFIAINCAAVPQTLLESELFGHRKGAFTGAERDRIGRFEAAGDGTVFLDEIDKASLDFQAKLLRVLDDRRITPVGANSAVRLEARVACATNRDLKALAAEGSFLSDLYFRLAAFRVRVPPLRERPEDIRALARHFLRGCRGRFGRARYSMSREAIKALVVYDWPGNVRELRNVIEAAAFNARHGGRIELQHLPEEFIPATSASPSATLPDRIREIEMANIRMALRQANGNKTVAAQILGVSRKGLLDRLRRLRIQDD